MSGAASEPTGPNCQRQRDYVTGKILSEKKNRISFVSNEWLWLNNKGISEKTTKLNTSSTPNRILPTTVTSFRGRGRTTPQKQPPPPSSGDLKDLHCRFICLCIECNQEKDEESWCLLQGPLCYFDLLPRKNVITISNFQVYSAQKWSPVVTAICCPGVVGVMMALVQA